MVEANRMGLRATSSCGYPPFGVGVLGVFDAEPWLLRCGNECALA